MLNFFRVMFLLLITTFYLNLNARDESEAVGIIASIPAS